MSKCISHWSMYLCYIFFIFTSTPSRAPRLNTFFTQVIVSKVPTHMFLGGSRRAVGQRFFHEKNLSGKSRWCFFGRKKVWRLGIESFVFSSFEWAFFPIKWKVIRKKVDFSRFPAKKKKSEKFTKKLGPLLILAVHRFQGFSWVNQPESYGKQLGGPPKPWTHVQLSYIDMT